MVDRTGLVVRVVAKSRGGREAVSPRKVRNLPPSVLFRLPCPPQGRFADLVTLLMIVAVACGTQGLARPASSGLAAIAARRGRGP